MNNDCIFFLQKLANHTLGFCHQGLSFLWSLPILTNPTHLWKKPYPACWWRNIKLIFLINERSENLTCYIFLTNHKAHFNFFYYYFRRSPFLKYYMEVCPYNLSNMGTSLPYVQFWPRRSPNCYISLHFLRFHWLKTSVKGMPNHINKSVCEEFVKYGLLFTGEEWFCMSWIMYIFSSGVSKSYIWVLSPCL